MRETLALRARRPEAFAGGYEPVETGPGVLSFRRAESVLVAVPLDPSTNHLLPDRRNLLGDDLPVGLYEDR